MTVRLLKYLVPLLCLAFTAPASSAKTVKVGEREVDSVLLYYFNRCNKLTRDAAVLPLADTLFRLAGEKGDTRMQAAALSYKADHFYYTGPKDSMFYWITRGKEFCRANKQFTHYYFIWNRLISWYTRRREFNLALNELRQLQTQATTDDFKPAIGDSYKRLGDIYNTKNDIPAAIYQYTKAIDFFTSNQLEDHNIVLLYCNLAGALLSVRQYDEALARLDEAEKTVIVPSQRYQTKIHRAAVYLEMGDTKKAKELLDECFAAEKAGKFPSSSLVNLYENLGLYYLRTNRPKEAVGIFHKMLSGQQVQNDGSEISRTSPYLTKLLQAHRMLRDTAAYFHTDSIYHAVLHQTSSEQTTTALGEFSTLLDVEKLNRENAEIELAAQQQKLRYNIFALVVLAVVLAGSIVFGLIQSRTSRRLRHSQEALLHKNEELARSEESLRVAKNEAEQASRMKSVFIRNVTHEIHTPLNAIVGFAPLVADKIAPYDAEAHAYMEIVQDNSRYLQKVVEDVLTLSDMESLAGAPPTEETDADEVCRRSIDRAGKAQPGVEIRYRNSMLHLETNPLGLSQILTNLLNNALKFTDRGFVELACGPCPDGQTAEFTVTDTGCGIPSRSQDAIFERFVKLDEFGQGMGLGLAVCRMIAEKLGGVIFLDTSYQGGTRFVVRLPLRQQRP